MQILAGLRERRARVRLHKAVGSEHTIALAEDWDDLEGLIRRMAIDVIVIDPRLNGHVAVEPVLRLRERYPSTPVILYTEFRIDLAPALLEWGDAGVCGAAFLDQSDASWDLRQLVNMASARSTAEQLLDVLQSELPELDEDVKRVLRVGLYEATRIGTVTEWADQTGIPRRRLYRLFARAGLPTPKTCLRWLRLLYAAKALADPGASIEDVVFRMRYSAPPNFWAHVHRMLGIGPSEMRWSVTAEDLADYFAELCRKKVKEATGDEVAGREQAG